jgi:hypothetical protein
MKLLWKQYGTPRGFTSWLIGAVAYCPLFYLKVPSEVSVGICIKDIHYVQCKPSLLGEVTNFESNRI